MSVINITIAALIVVGPFLGACALFIRGRVATALLVAGLLTTLTGLAVGVQTHGWVTGLDAGIASWFSTHRSAGFTVAASVVTGLGSPTATAAAGLICGALLAWRARAVTPGVAVVGTVGAAALAGIALKAVIVRPWTPAELELLGLTGHDNPFPSGYVPDSAALVQAVVGRPGPWTPAELQLLPLILTDHPFPSGHVTGTAALLGIIAVCVGAGRSRTARAGLIGLSAAGALVVALTRLYVGAHWLTDVIGGALLAGAFVTLGAAVFGGFRARSGQDRYDTASDDATCCG